MCFYIPKDQRRAMIAKNDIPCFKIVYQKDDGTFKSYHFKFTWELGKLYRNRRFKVMRINYPSSGKGTREGFHSLSELEYSRHRKYISFGTIAIVNCIIPKGARYFHDPTNKTYFSNQLIMSNVAKTKPIKNEYPTSQKSKGEIQENQTILAI